MVRILSLLLAVALAPVPGIEKSHPRMAVSVIAVTPGHDPIPGVTISLCPEGKTEGCIYRSSGPYGSIRFDDIAPARYIVRAEAAGFLPTMVGPLRFDEVSRGRMRIPDLVLLMNPVAVY
ncbi:MAG: hypothetical protein ACJ76Y_15730 [Thermoanaerobaculia bacterium]